MGLRARVGRLGGKQQLVQPVSVVHRRNPNRPLSTRVLRRARKSPFQCPEPPGDLSQTFGAYIEKQVRTIHNKSEGLFLRHHIEIPEVADLAMPGRPDSIMWRIDCGPYQRIECLLPRLVTKVLPVPGEDRVIPSSTFHEFSCGHN